MGKSHIHGVVSLTLVLATASAAQSVPGLIANRRLTDQDVPAVLHELEVERLQAADVGAPWWQRHTQAPMSANVRPLPAGVNDLLQLALQYSAQISVARFVPGIRETAVVEADSAFNWSQFFQTTWNDTSDPVGNALTVGGPSDRFNDHLVTADAGVRRRLLSGADLEVYQTLSHQNNNSNFFIPNDQGAAKLVLGFTQPLLRGRGKVYNESLIVLANIDVGTANDEFQRQLRSHLLEVARGYWSLYLERSHLAQRVNLYRKTEAIVEQLHYRQAIDTQRTQLITAQAALAARKADLIRARAAVKNAETRLRALINAPQLMGDPESLEIIPQDRPTTKEIPISLIAEFQTAVQNRPEVAAAIKEIKAGMVRLNMADNEMLPVLDLVTETYVAGLRGRSEVLRAWEDQFTRGAPSYSIGVQYELPLGRRAAGARRRRRQLEIKQLQEKYRTTLELIRAEVEVAVREVEVSFQELRAKNRALGAAIQEAETFEIRWRRLVDPSATASLAIESLLQAQERVTNKEFELAKALLTYNLSLINLRYANGTLMSVDFVQPPPTPKMPPAIPQDETIPFPQEQLRRFPPADAVPVEELPHFSVSG